MSKASCAAWCWLVVALFSAAYLGRGLYGGTLNVETNLLALLPETERDPTIEKIVARLGEDSASRFSLALEHKDPETALNAGRWLRKKLSAMPELSMNETSFNEGPEQISKLAFEYREALISNKTSDRLKAGSTSFFEAILADYYSPIADLSRVKEDPLLLFPALMQQQLALLPKAEFRDGLLIAQSNGLAYALIQGKISGSAFSSTVQREVVDALAPIEAEMIREFPELQVHRSGIIWFAERSARTTRADISMISSLSSLIVTLMLLFAFFSLRPIVLSYIALSVAFVVAGAVSFLLFPSLHAITLGFGTTLIGVCVDYPLHYFCHELSGSKSRREVVKAIFPGVTLGMFTSLLSFLGLIVTPFPGLTQMALFSSIGILAAYLSVMLWYPYLSPASIPARASPLQPLASAMLRFFNIAGKGAHRIALLFVVLLLALALPTLKVQDDIRALDSLPGDLVTDERLIQSLLQLQESGSFFIVEGSDLEQLLQREETLRQRLLPLQERGLLSGARALSQIVPSKKTQIENLALLKSTVFNNSAQLKGFIEQSGVSESSFELLKSRIDQKNLLDPGKLLSSSLGGLLKALFQGESGRGVASVVWLGDFQDSSPLQELESTLPGCTFVDKIRDTSNLLGRYRRAASYLTLGCYLVVIAVVLVRYGLRLGLLVMIPPLLGATSALAFLALLNIPLNLFSSFGLLLVLGLGVDYGIFFAEKELPRDATMLAVMLSAFSNALAFGLLLFSSSPILLGFGATVFGGIIGTLLGSPLVRAKS